MQPTSSGSSLINSDKKIIGQLYGLYWCADIQCDNPVAQIVAYGKFSVSWTGSDTPIPAKDNRRKLQPWLDPNNTETVWNGLCVPSAVYFTNKTVATNTTITSCGTINIQNVKVLKGAKLILEAEGEVNIIGDFEVEIGAEFEIR